MTTAITRSMELLDAVQRSLPERVRLQPMATDEGLLVQVEQMLRDEGAQVTRAHIETVARQLDQQKGRAPAPEVEVTPAPSASLALRPSVESPLPSRWVQWQIKGCLAVARWLTRWARSRVPDQDVMQWGGVEEGLLTPEERQSLVALSAQARRQSPILPQDEATRWRIAIWEVMRERRYACGSSRPYEPLTSEQRQRLGAIPQGQDPLTSAHFRSSPFEEADRTVLADLMYHWLDEPDVLAKNKVDFPLMDHLVRFGLSPDVDQGRVWLGSSHPTQTGWTVRQSCAYWLLDEALQHLEKASLPVPKEENQSLLWWATQAHHDITLPRYWGYWATAPAMWGKRFQDTVRWILSHEFGAPYHAKLLRKALAQNHPESEWIRKEMKRRGWTTF